MAIRTLDIFVLYDLYFVVHIFLRRCFQVDNVHEK